MKIVEPSYEILYPNLENDEIRKDICKRIEGVGRTCYKSENNITDESAERFIFDLERRKHEAVLEHACMTIKFIVDRGVSHEIVRHRIASFAQESTRYCNYSKAKFGSEITVIRPYFYNDPDRQEEYETWKTAMENAEKAYFRLLELGSKPEEARAVLPNSLKTELVVTTNMREWRHILNLRAAGTTGKPHPQMIEVMLPLLKYLRTKLPAFYSDIYVNWLAQNTVK